VTTGSEPIPAPKPTESQQSAVTTTSLSEPYHEVIADGLSRGRNAMSIWQELVDRHGFTGAYQSVRRYVRKLNGPSSPEARVVIRTAPAKKPKVITAPDRASVIPTLASIAAPIVCDDSGLQPQVNAPADLSLQYPHLTLSRRPSRSCRRMEV